MISQTETATAPSLITKSPTIISQRTSPSPEANGKSVNTKHTSSYHTNNHHHSPSKSSSPSAALHNNSSSSINNNNNSNSSNNNTNTKTSSTTSQKSPNLKRRKRFEETIIDGFSVIAFKTWEDLQDELNERSSLLSNSTATAAAADSASGNSYDHSVVKKASSKSRHKSSTSSSSATTNLDATSIVTNSNGASTTTTSVATTTTTSSDHNHHKDGAKKKKKDKIRKSPSHSPEHHPKEKRNKTSSSDKDTLKKALEAKELAEKRLSILQKKLELEQSKNRSSTHIDSNDKDHNQKTTSIVPEHYPNNNNPTDLHNHHHNQSMRKDDVINHSKTNNNSIGHDQTRDQLSYHLNAPKPAPYSPFHINSHLQRTKTVIQQPAHTPPPMHTNSSASHSLSQSHHHLSPTKQHLPTSNIIQPPNQHHRTTSPPQSVIRESYPPRTPPLSSQSSTSSYQQQRPPHYHGQSQPATHPMIPPNLQQMHHNPLHPYSSQPASSMMSMGLGPLASPYSCPSICITDTISRQTSIIPPLGAALEQSTQQTSTRYGHHPAMLAHPSAHLTPPGHPMFYPIPQTPTERSFMEFVRSYPAPNHMNYPSLMNSLIPPSSLQAGSAGTAPPTPHQGPPPTPLTVPPSFTASPYGFDRSWPRLSLDHRAVNRYHNSIYNPTNPIPERPYASYASGRPPPFHAGLFQPPF